MGENNNVENTTVKLLVLCFIVFFVLKIMGIVSWPWWYVTMPLWVPFGVVVFLFLLLMIIFGIICIGFLGYIFLTFIHETFFT